MIQLALEMLLTQSGDLDPVYIKSLSEVQHLSVIQQHLSTERNAGLAGALQAWAAQAGEPVMRLLRLTSRWVTFLLPPPSAPLLLPPPSAPYDVLAQCIIVCKQTKSILPT